MANATASRRVFLKAMAFSPALPQSTGRRESLALPPWTRGEFDIHHISTGRGSCAFVIAPDGTTLMIDAGSLFPDPSIEKYVVPAYPNDSRSPAEWIVRYVCRRLRGIREAAIDVFVASHFHGDHIGELRSGGGPRSKDGTHQLTGITEIASLMPVRRIIDRDYPTYRYPAELTEEYQKNYLAFISSFRRNGGAVDRFVPGSSSQIRLLRNAEAYGNFEVRNIAANGEVWTGVGDKTRSVFPPLSSLRPKDFPSENMCSIALRLSYGNFRYFTPGDMTSETIYGRHAWMDIETPSAQAAGPVNAAVASHHGYADATGPSFVAALRPRVFLVLAWDSAHPTIHALHNMLSTQLYPGPRDVFATALKPESAIATRRLSELKSSTGHVVIRVAKGGASFRVLIVDNSDEADRVAASFGPYECT
jgi:beta-lactamase superfamily II metal-dependent hydrolase